MLKTPQCSVAMSEEHKSKFAAPSPVMVASA